MDIDTEEELGPILETTGDVQPSLSDESLDLRTEPELISSAIDEAYEVTEGLETLKEMMLESLEYNGLDKNSLAVVQLTANQLNKKFGKPLPGFATESIDAIESTNYAIESVSDSIKHHLQKIIAFVIKWYNRINAFMKNYISMAKLYEVHLGSTIESLAPRYEGYVKEDEQIELRESDFINLSTTDTVVNKVSERVKEFYTAYSLVTERHPAIEIASNVVDILTVHHDMLDTDFKDNLSLIHVGKTLINAFPTKLKITSDTIHNSTERVVLAGEETLLGSRIIVCLLTGHICKSSNFRYFTGFQIMTKQESIIASLPHKELHAVALNKKEVMDLFIELKKLAKLLYSKKVDLNKREELIKRYIKEAEDFEKLMAGKVQGSLTAEQLDNYNTFRSMISNMGHISLSLAQPELDLYKQGIRSIHAGYNYGLKCLANLKKV